MAERLPILMPELVPAKLRELLSAVPFVPFTVTLRDGTSTTVGVVDLYQDCVASDRDGSHPRIWLNGRRYDPADIAAIKPAGDQS
jgi:hypothetical protein